MSPAYTLVGTPFSTFTRTIALGLCHKGLEFDQLPATPSSEIAFQYHPFGYLPTLVIHGIDGKSVDLKLSESQAIVRYIDRVAPEPSLHLRSSSNEPEILEEKMWEVASLTACFGFPIVEGGVVKPHVKAIDEGKLSEDVILGEVQQGVEKLKEFLGLIEARMIPSAKFAFGDQPTWADFFLFPLLADLRTLPEWKVASPRIVAWMSEMDELDAVKKTTPGTLSVGARP